MRAALLTTCLALLPAPAAVPAAARCLTAADLADGIAFARADGRRGLAVAAGGVRVRIDYAVNSKAAWEDRRIARLGIYEVSWDWVPTDETHVGGGPGGQFDFVLSGRPSVPAPGGTWRTRVRATLTREVGLESGPAVSRDRLEVAYSFQEAREVRHSGCTYAPIPVEATILGKDLHRTQRWIYFPDLGFGLETRVTDHLDGEDRRLGLTALAPAR